MKIALIQICSKLDPALNLERINELILKAKREKPDTEAIFLPEVFYSMSDGRSVTPYLVEGENEHFEKIKNIAIKHKINLLGGSAATKVGERVYNRSFNFSPTGELLSFYDKIHLFKIDLKSNTNSTVIDESKNYTAGSELKMFELNEFKFGLNICFDLRFPELFRKHFQNGVEVFTLSSAFTVPTGRAHWETLLRARAIENQAYIIACNQCGVHNDYLSSYGHSMVVNPWGEVIAQAGEDEAIIYAELDKEFLNKVRGRMDMKRQLPT